MYGLSSRNISSRISPMMAMQTGNKYGNGFTPFRLLSAAMTDSNFWTRNMSNFSDLHKLETLLQQLKNIAETTPQESGESDTAYQSRIFRLQRDHIKEEHGSTLLNNGLFYLFKDHVYGSSVEGSQYIEKVALELEEIARKQGITGILHGRKIVGDVVSGYAWRLEVSPTNRFCTTDNKPFRIFGKFDSPRFDLSLYSMGKKIYLAVSLSISL